MGPPDNSYNTNMKRRRTDWPNEPAQPLNFDTTQESSFDIFATTSTSSSDRPSGHLATEMYNANFSINQQMVPAPTSEQSTTMKLLHVEIPGPQYDTSIPSTHRLLNRSKSMLPEPDSPNDTEPMSSITFARARRAISDFVDPQQSQQQSTFDASAGELAISESVELNTSGTKTLNEVILASERDELASEDFGGMPKEMYKPKPSRSRGMKQVSVGPADAEPEAEMSKEADAQYQSSGEQEEPDNEELGVIPVERYKPRPSRSRSKIHESIAFTEAEPDSVKNTRTQEVSDGEDELASEDFGGMPKEMYKPLPSRFRGKTRGSVEPESAEVQPETKSKKRRRSPSPEQDELNFEVIEDIPRKQYNPRPSRSRSKPSDLVYIDQGTHKGHDPGLAVVIPQEVPVDRVQQADERQHKIKFEPMDEDSPQSQHLFEDNREEPLSEPDPIDTIRRQEHTPAPDPAVPQPKKGRKRKGTVGSEATSRAASTVPEKPAPKNRGRKKNAAETPAPEPTVVSGLEDPFTNETSACTTTAAQETNAEREPMQHDKENAPPPSPQAPENKPQPPPESKTPNPAPQPQLQNQNQLGLSTPEKQNPAQSQTPPKYEKGPDKHSPISIRNKVPYRVGLSRRARIAPLLKVVRK